jgi:hypothetical protein
LEFNRSTPLPQSQRAILHTDGDNPCEPKTFTLSPTFVCILLVWWGCFLFLGVSASGELGGAYGALRVLRDVDCQGVVGCLG